MRRLFVVGSVLLLAGTASIAQADPITESPQPQPSAAAVVQADQPTLPVVAGATTLSKAEKASVDGRHGYHWEVEDDRYGFYHYRRDHLHWCEWTGWSHWDGRREYECHTVR